jgi:ethanolamine utilization microcompartment shell protein EutL
MTSPPVVHARMILVGDPQPADLTAAVTVVLRLLVENDAVAQTREGHSATTVVPQVRVGGTEAVSAEVNARIGARSEVLVGGPIERARAEARC